jgi:hypothetical protein
METRENLEEVDILSEPIDYGRYCAWEREHFKDMPRERQNKLGFILFIIYKFADTYKMNKVRAYRYLKEYGGLEFIFDHWWALHVDNPSWVVRDILKICKRNGGTL